MRRPNHVFPPGNVVRTGTNKPLPEPHHDAAAYDEFIKAHGLRWTHYKSAFCPNVSDIDNRQHDPNCRTCDNGYIFYGGAEVMGFLEQGKLERFYEIQGLWEAGQAIVTFTSYQDGPDGSVSKGPMNDFLLGDKVVCLDYTFAWPEIVEINRNGVDRLKYPALEVEFLSDVDREYKESVDFKINSDGFIEWLPGGKRPAWQPDKDRGSVYSIRYSANPVYFVEQVLREIRATKGENRETGAIEAVRLPQQLLIKRDFMFKHPADNVGKADTDPA
jgi:hypothetical protein